MVSFDGWYGAVARGASAYERACQAAFGPEQYIGQNGFSTRDDILALGASVVPCGNPRVLDICCGSGAPGRFVANALGCTMIGVDSSEPALRQLSANPQAHVRGVAGEAMQLPFRADSFDAAIVLDSVASISSIQDLFEEVARVLRPGARLGCTAEIGDPLTAAERALFTHSHPPTVLERNELIELLGVCGFHTVEIHDCTRRTASIARRLVESIRENREIIRRELGVRSVDDLVPTLGTLADMLTGGRLQEVAVVAQFRRPYMNHATDTSSRPIENPEAE